MITRPSRLVAAIVTIFSLLFMQLAVASYVCPGDLLGEPAMEYAEEMPASGDCMGSDMEQPARCHAHAQADSQSLDKPASPAVTAFAPVTLFTALPALSATYRPDAPRAGSPLLVRTTAPPLAIRHCRFQI
jgi:hypothetical protein